MKVMNEIPEFEHLSTSLRIRNNIQTTPYIMFGTYKGQKVKVIKINETYDTLREIVSFRLFIKNNYSEFYNFCFPKLLLCTKNYYVFEYIEGEQLRYHNTKSRLIIDTVDKYIASNLLNINIDWEIKNFIQNDTGVYHIDIDAFNFKEIIWK